MSRILVLGGPRVGKTTLAKRLGAELGITPWSTDDLMATHDWSGASAEVARWIDRPGPWVIEGVAVARALRKWLAAHPTGRPADALYLGVEPRERLTTGQSIMVRGCATVWGEVRWPLERRGLVATEF